MLFKLPHKQKSEGVKSGELGGVTDCGYLCDHLKPFAGLRNLHRLYDVLQNIAGKPHTFCLLLFWAKMDVVCCSRT
jgi:hypothetical protein